MRRNSLSLFAKLIVPSMSPPISRLTIRTGDTLSKIAEQNHTTVDDLLAANPQITDKDQIIAGKTLVLPQASDGYNKPVERDRNTGPLKTPEKVAATGLDGVRSGDVVLSNGAKGPAGKDMQQKLEAAGYKLKRFGADGDFGHETETALKAFQKNNGLDQTGKLDKDTLVKLDTGATQKAKYPEYDKLFADGVLRQTLAVGYDEGGNHIEQTKKLVDGLVGQGYSPVDVSKMSDADIQKNLGVDPKTIDKDGTYFVKHFQHGGKDVTAVTRLITPETPNAKQKFADAMANDEVVMYTGHGRYGSGPDFDDIKSPAGNFRIGDPFEKGHVTLGENDLAKTKMTKGYQLMFFDGCNTKYYMDDLRTKAKGKDTSNLDVIGANTELPWSTSATDILAVTQGITDGASINDIKTRLNANNAGGPVKDKFLADGFSGQRRRAAREVIGLLALTLLSDMRVEEIKALGKSKDVVGAIDSLGKALDSREEGAREATLAALRELLAARDFPKLLDDKKTPLKTRRNVLKAMRFLKEPRFTPMVVKALGDADGGLRAEAALVLAVYGAGDAEPQLIGALGDAEKDVRYYAAEALGSCKSDAAKKAVLARQAVELDKTVLFSLQQAEKRQRAQ